MITIPRSVVKRLQAECRLNDAEVLYLAAVVRKRGKEVLEVVTRCGKGSRNRVEISDRCVEAMVALLSTGARLVLIHTHPDGSPLSEKDVEVSKRLGIPIVAVSCIDGSIDSYEIEISIEDGEWVRST